MVGNRELTPNLALLLLSLKGWEHVYSKMQVTYLAGNMDCWGEYKVDSMLVPR